MDLDSWTFDVVNCDSKHFLRGSLSLEVDAHDLAVSDLGIHDLHPVHWFWFGKNVDAARVEVHKLGVRDEDVGIDVYATTVMIGLIANDFAARQVDQGIG